MQQSDQEQWEPRREQILEALKQEPLMTIEQLAALNPYKKDGSVLKPLLPKGRARERTGAYSMVGKTLRLLLRGKENPDGLLTRFREHPSEQYLYAYHPYRFPENYFNRKHEIACGDIYVAYKVAEVLKHWDAEPEAHKKLLGLTDKLKYDRRMLTTFNDSPFYWEVDRGTEDLDVITAKVKAYQKFGQQVDFRFYVIFTVKDTRYGTINERCEDIINVIAECETVGFQFLVARHADVVKNPMGQVFLAANRPDRFMSLSELTSA